MSWFKATFGFEEGSSYSKNRSKFRMDGDDLVCESSQWPRQHVGPFSTPSVAELREMVARSGGGGGGGEGLRFEHLATPTGVNALFEAEESAGALFLAASQFNCLEMTGPGVSPQRGIAIYASDPTQGPKCAMACPAATVYRNYLCDGGRGQGERQLDCLQDVGTVLGNGDPNGSSARWWTMRNGYALPSRPTALAELSQLLHETPDLVAEAGAALRVGVHWSTQVAPPRTHRVAQVFASALPIAYASGPPREWEPFARLVLRSAYEATLLAARYLSASGNNRRVKVRAPRHRRTEADTDAHTVVAHAPGKATLCDA